jgi:hypothetical protein
VKDDKVINNDENVSIVEGVRVTVLVVIYLIGYSIGSFFWWVLNFCIGIPYAFIGGLFAKPLEDIAEESRRTKENESI